MTGANRAGARGGKDDIRAELAGDTLYARLRAHVLTLPPDSAIASERKLARMYELSASTVRRALDRLCDEGLIYKQHGRGTFVAERADAAGTRDVVWTDTWGDAGHSYYERRRQGMVSEASRHGLRIVMEAFPDGQLELERLCAAVERRGVVGLIVPWLWETTRSRLFAARPELKIVTTAGPATGPNTASVRPDYVAVGREGSRWLKLRGRGMLAIVRTSAETLAGVMSTSPGAGEPDGLIDMPVDAESDLDEVAKRITRRKMKGVLVDDDRVAVRLVQALQARDPRVLSRTAVASLANIGEDLLPEGVARLTIDGADAGRLIVSVLTSMIEDALFMGTDVRLRPHLVEPGHTRPVRGGRSA